MTIPVRNWWLVLFPLLLAALLTFHPAAEGTVIYDGLHDQVTPWLAVHLGLIGGACLMAVALRRLLRGLTGRAATVSRVSLVVFGTFFAAWEATVGIGTGLLVNHANSLPAGPERDAVAGAIQEHFTNPVIGDPSIIGMTGNIAWIVAVIAAGIAVRRAGAGFAAALLLCLASLFTAHSILLGPIGLACFAAAALLVERARARSAHPAALTVTSPDPAVAPIMRGARSSRTSPGSTDTSPLPASALIR